MAGIVMVFLLKVGVLWCYFGVEARLDFGVEVLTVRVESWASDADGALSVIE